ncbi:hypothetical protein CC80DRAFT_477034 [Byssothecium circinans]|uniref:Uncharacterized protein n=1 Tax=Byssothecium circinans TaxID=147558 RepID=A0A6A5TMS6_9PLEO|nr:hypothetical protein CC80DRAFT_477034 [Byssothecium circinans]
MAATTAMANRHIVSTILHHLSDMKYKERRQYGPDQPVEFLEFRPTLVPAILVNRLWADEGTAVLWRRYPRLPALKIIAPDRRQYYADKVQRVFVVNSPAGSMEYLDGLQWPNLRTLESGVDFARHGEEFRSMLHGGLKHLELSGYQSGDSRHFENEVLPVVYSLCTGLESIRIGPEIISEDDSLHVIALYDLLDSVPSVTNIELKSTNLVGRDTLFTRLSQRPSLEGLEIDLDPGLTLVPLLSQPEATMFLALKRLSIICYPEVAIALPQQLSNIEELRLDISRIPSQPLHDDLDQDLLDSVLSQLTTCQNLRLLQVGISQLTEEFPSARLCPRLSGDILVKLSGFCPALEDINILVIEPSAIDGANISTEEFDAFCRNLPRLRALTLKLNPVTTVVLAVTALQSLGSHCRDLETVRLKLPCELPNLRISKAIPRIFINGQAAGGTSQPVEPPAQYVSSLFPNLTHLAIVRPKTALYTNDTYSAPLIDADLEEDIVRSWAYPLLTHFPRLKILEAWGDYSGSESESLNYFLPTEEILASTWEFLSGVEQDLWEGDEAEDNSSWHTWDSGEDWDKAELMDEFMPDY